MNRKFTNEHVKTNNKVIKKKRLSLTTDQRSKNKAAACHAYRIGLQRDKQQRGHPGLTEVCGPARSHSRLWVLARGHPSAGQVAPITLTMTTATAESFALGVGRPRWTGSPRIKRMCLSATREGGPMTGPARSPRATHLAGGGGRRPQGVRLQGLCPRLGRKRGGRAAARGPRVWEFT